LLTRAGDDGSDERSEYDGVRNVLRTIARHRSIPDAIGGEGVTPTLVAGAAAGSVALLVFVALHAVWIVPIWGMLSMIPIAALVGALAAWPFEQLSARGALPSAPFDGIAFVGLLLLTLVPTTVMGVFAGPVDRDRITVPAVLVPLLLAAPAGVLIGALLVGVGPASLALGAAAFAVALTLGHNLPFFPVGSPSWERAFGLVLLVEAVAGATFSAARALISAGIVLPAR